MLKKVLKKDILVSLKDRKIQIFMMIILLLYLLSAVTFISTYKKEREQFFNDVKQQYKMNEKYSENMMKFISEGSLYYFKKPVLTSIIFPENGYPTKIVSEVCSFRPRIVEKKAHSKNNMYLSWLFIIGVIESFTALLFSYDAISKEKKSGTLRLKIVNGVSRFKVFISKYLNLIILFTFANILGIFLSVIFFNLIFGIHSFYLVLNAALLILVSLPFISFFILLGLIISTSKNNQTNIVVALAFWLLLVFIIPNISIIIGEKIQKLKSERQYEKEWRSTWRKVYSKWTEKYDDREKGIHKVAGNSYLEEGYRAKAVYEMGNKVGRVYEKQLNESIRQLEVIQKISMVSPYSLLEISISRIAELGLPKLKSEMKQLKEFQNKVENKLKQYDKKDENSLHLFYDWSYSDRKAVDEDGLTPFTDMPYPEPSELILTNYKNKKIAVRIKRALPAVMILVVINIFIVIFAFLKIRKLDVR